MLPMRKKKDASRIIFHEKNLNKSTGITNSEIRAVSIRLRPRPLTTVPAMKPRADKKNKRSVLSNITIHCTSRTIA